MPNTPQIPAPLALPVHVAGFGSLDRLVETARGYAQQAVSENTRIAYGRDWAGFARWCRLRSADPLPPSPELIGLYITDLAAPSKARALSVASIERRWPGYAGATRREGCGLSAAIGTSSACSPAPAAAMPDRRCRRRRSGPTTCAGCVTGRCC